MRKREVAELATEMVLVLSRVPEDVYQREKIMVLLNSERSITKDCWKQIFSAAEQRRPLLLECKGRHHAEARRYQPDFKRVCEEIPDKQERFGKAVQYGGVPGLSSNDDLYWLKNDDLQKLHPERIHPAKQ